MHLYKWQVEIQFKDLAFYCQLMFSVFQVFFLYTCKIRSMKQSNIDNKQTALRFIIMNNFNVKLIKYQLRIVPLFFLNAIILVFSICLLICPYYIMMKFFISPAMTNTDYLFTIILNLMGLFILGCMHYGKPKKFTSFINKIYKNYMFVRYIIKYGRYFGCNLEGELYINRRQQLIKDLRLKRINEEIENQYRPWKF